MDVPRSAIPKCRRHRVSKNANVIEVGVPDVAPFHFEEDLLEDHDGGCLQVSTMTQGGGEQGMGESPLSGFHVAQGQTQTLAVWLDEVARHEVPSFRSLSFQEKTASFLALSSSDWMKRWAAVAMSVAGS